MNGNFVLLVGYVGRHLQTFGSEQGKIKVSIRVATHYKRATPEGPKTETVWHDVIAWNRTALFAQNHFVKGSRILVQGSIHYRTWFDYAGHKRYNTEIKAVHLTNLDR